ncbi:MAG: preprotein translocase subunit SecE [Planctomycetota bacterium]|nr:preprotein translocase subunit SecE [Planctomycetota bacterium]
MIIGVLIAGYAALSWFAWLRPLSASTRFESYVNPAFIGAIILLFGIIVLFAWLSFRSARSSDYLIDMDDELRKVVWPSVMPLFDPKTEAWGSTYVVIVCSILFTVFIWVVDLMLQLAVTRGLFQSLLFS